MPFSYPDFKKDVRHYLLEEWRDFSGSILDVGPGAGTYAQLLPELGMDALEVWEGYVKDYCLREVYRDVYLGNACELFVSTSPNMALCTYKAYIFGDVLEHFSVYDAQRIVTFLTGMGARLLVAVPFCLEQGAWFDNTYETHLQPDLTLEVMAARYPTLRPIFTNERYGYFVNQFCKLPPC